MARSCAVSIAFRVSSSPSAHSSCRVGCGRKTRWAPVTFTSRPSAPARRAAAGFFPAAGCSATSPQPPSSTMSQVMFRSCLAALDPEVPGFDAGRIRHAFAVSAHLLDLALGDGRRSRAGRLQIAFAALAGYRRSEQDPNATAVYRQVRGLRKPPGHSPAQPLPAMTRHSPDRIDHEVALEYQEGPTPCTRPWPRRRNRAPPWTSPSARAVVSGGG